MKALPDLKTPEELNSMLRVTTRTKNTILAIAKAKRVPAGAVVEALLAKYGEDIEKSVGIG
jgi:ABC-type molybdate transport system substrate-binding protein